MFLPPPAVIIYSIRKKVYIWITFNFFLGGGIRLNMGPLRTLEKRQNPHFDKDK